MRRSSGPGASEGAAASEDGPLFVSGRVIGLILDAANSQYPNVCGICRRELVPDSLSDGPPYRLLDYYLIRCSSEQRHVYHTKCFLGGTGECVLCQLQRRRRVCGFLFGFVDSLLSDSGDHVNYETKQHLFRFWDSRGKSCISGDIDALGYEAGDLELLRTKICDLGNVGPDSNLLTVIQSKTRIMRACELSSDDFHACLTAGSAPHIPGEILDIRLPETVLRGLDLRQLLEIMRAVVSSEYPDETKERHVSRVAGVIGSSARFAPSADALYDLLLLLVENDQAGLIRHLYEDLDAATRMEHNKALEVAILYVQKCTFDTASFKYLCMYVLENTVQTAAQTAEFLDVFRGEPAAVCRDDLCSVVRRDGRVQLGSCFTQDASFSDVFRAKTELRRTAVQGPAFAHFLESLHDFRFSYKLFPREFWNAERDAMLLQAVVRSGSDEDVTSCLAHISRRGYYGADAFLRVFDTVAQSRMRCHILTLINAAKDDVFDALQGGGRVAGLVARLVNLGLHWCIPHMERHIRDERRFKQLLDDHFSNIMAFYYHGSGSAEYPSQFFVPPGPLCKKHVEAMRYDTELTFNYRYFAEYLKCLARTGVSRRRMEFVIREMCRNQKHMVHVTKEDVCAVTAFFAGAEDCAMHLGALLGSCCPNDLKNYVRLEMIRTLAPEEGDGHCGLDLRDIASPADKLQYLCTRTRGFLEDLMDGGRSKDLMQHLSKIDGRHLMRLFRARRCRDDGPRPPPHL